MLEKVTVIYTVYGTVCTDEITGERRSVQLTGASAENASSVTLKTPGILRRPGRPDQPVKFAHYRNAEVIYVEDAEDAR